MPQYRWQVWVIQGEREWCKWLCHSREQGTEYVDRLRDSWEYDAVYLVEGEYRA